MTYNERIKGLLASATKGPWQVDGVRRSGDLKIGKNTRLHFIGPDGDDLAAVFFDMKTGRGFIDAKLIAEAPTIAARLIEAEAQMERMAIALEEFEDAWIAAIRGDRPRSLGEFGALAKHHTPAAAYKRAAEALASYRAWKEGP